jgi:hypothetical protein
LAVPFSMELRKLEIALYFSVPVEIIEVKRVFRVARGKGARTFEKKRYSRTRRVDKNLALLLSTSIVTQRLRGLSLKIAVVCKSEVITVFVRKYFPHQRNVLGLAKQQDSRLVDFL